MADDNQHLPQVKGLKVKGTFLHLLPFDKLAAMIDDKLWKIDLPSKDQPAFAYIRKDPVRLSAQPKSPEDSPISSPLYCGEKDIKRQNKVLEALGEKEQPLSDNDIDALFRAFCCEAEPESEDEVPLKANTSERMSDEGIANSAEIADQYKNKRPHAKRVLSDGALCDKVNEVKHMTDDGGDGDNQSILSNESDMTLPDCGSDNGTSTDSAYLGDTISTATDIVDSLKGPNVLERLCCAAKRVMLSHCNCVKTDTVSIEGDFVKSETDSIEGDSVDAGSFTDCEDFPLWLGDVEDSGVDSQKSIVDETDNDDNGVAGNVSVATYVVPPAKKPNDSTGTYVVPSAKKPQDSTGTYVVSPEKEPNHSTGTYVVPSAKKPQDSTGTYVVPPPKKPGKFKKFCATARKVFKKNNSVSPVSLDESYTTDESFYERTSSINYDDYYEDVECSNTEEIIEFEKQFLDPDNVSFTSFIYPPDGLTGFELFGCGSALSISSDDFFDNCDLNSVDELDINFIEHLSDSKPIKVTKVTKKPTLVKRFRKAGGRFLKKYFVCGKKGDIK